MKKINLPVIYRTRPVKRVNDIVTKGSLRGYFGHTNKYKHMLEIFRSSEKPIRMQYEIFEAREGLTVFYCNMSFMVDGMKRTRVYHHVGDIAEEQFRDLQYHIGTPLVFSSGNICITITEKPSKTIVEMVVTDNGCTYTTKRITDKSTGVCKNLTTITCRDEEDSARIAKKLREKEDLNRPLINYVDGVKGTVLVDNEHMKVEFPSFYFTHSHLR